MRTINFEPPMPNKDLSPLAVVEYSKNYIIAFVRHQTGWDQRSEVSDKIQLNYLCKYLGSNEISAKTIIVENEYIDGHYLEDYSEYYARCFPYHPRKCSRLHFFSNSFDESGFIAALEGSNKELLNELPNNYIGFAVIRPIPHTFLARLCLKRYSKLTSNPKCKLIAKKVTVSLFGIPLEIESAPFLEQDKVVSACATSALWMFFNASHQEFNGNLPSPSAITKSATRASNEGVRTFPTNGLTPTQVSRSLKCFGFEPMILDLNPDWLAFKELIYAYASNNIPVLIAGSVYQQNKDTQKVTHPGKHLVCALGYQLAPTILKEGDEMRLVSHNINKVYVHDDRYGPYIRISMDSIEFNYEDGAKQGLELSLKASDDKDYFIPELAIFGLYHKIRLTYFDIKEMCSALHIYLQGEECKFSELLNNNEDTINKNRKDITDIAQSINQFTKGTFEITLTSNTKIKEELRSEKLFTTFNGITRKSTSLLHSMPKYIWRCRVRSYQDNPSNEQLFTDILFDATEVAQGQVLVGYISYSTQAERVWNHIGHDVHNNTAGTKNDIKIRQGISGFLKFFYANKNKTNLNIKYGPLGLPRRDLHDGELDTFNNISIRKDVQIIRAGNTSFWETLDLNKQYIWVINELGDLVLGEDILDEDNNKQGHPTLVDGRAARLGGELYYNHDENCWFVNLKSKTYSRHIKDDPELSKAYLRAVIEDNLKGKEVGFA